MNQLKKVLTQSDAKYIVENIEEIKALIETNLSHPLYKDYKAICTPKRLKVLDMFSKGVGIEFSDYGDWEWATAYRCEVPVKFLTKNKVRPLNSIRIEMKPDRVSLTKAKGLEEFMYKYPQVSPAKENLYKDIERLRGNTFKWVTPEQYLLLTDVQHKSIVSLLGVDKQKGE